MYYIVSDFIVPPGGLIFNDHFVVVSLVCHFRLVYVVVATFVYIVLRCVLSVTLLIVVDVSVG